MKLRHQNFRGMDNFIHVLPGLSKCLLISFSRFASCFVLFAFAIGLRLICSPLSLLHWTLGLNSFQFVFVPCSALSFCIPDLVKDVRFQFLSALAVSWEFHPFGASLSLDPFLRLLHGSRVSCLVRISISVLGFRFLDLRCISLGPHWLSCLCWSLFGQFGPQGSACSPVLCLLIPYFVFCLLDPLASGLLIGTVLILRFAMWVLPCLSLSSHLSLEIAFAFVRHFGCSFKSFTLTPPFRMSCLICLAFYCHFAFNLFARVLHFASGLWHRFHALSYFVICFVGASFSVLCLCILDLRCISFGPHWLTRLCLSLFVLFGLQGWDFSPVLCLLIPNFVFCLLEPLSSGLFSGTALFLRSAVWVRPCLVLSPRFPLEISFAFVRHCGCSFKSVSLTLPFRMSWLIGLAFFSYFAFNLFARVLHFACGLWHRFHALSYFVICFVGASFSVLCLCILDLQCISFGPHWLTRLCLSLFVLFGLQGCDFSPVLCLLIPNFVFCLLEPLSSGLFSGTALFLRSAVWVRPCLVLSPRFPLEISFAFVRHCGCSFKSVTLTLPFRMSWLIGLAFFSYFASNLFVCVQHFACRLWHRLHALSLSLELRHSALSFLPFLLHGCFQSLWLVSSLWVIILFLLLPLCRCVVYLPQSCWNLGYEQKDPGLVRLSGFSIVIVRDLHPFVSKWFATPNVVLGDIRVVSPGFSSCLRCFWLRCA